MPVWAIDVQLQRPAAASNVAHRERVLKHPWVERTFALSRPVSDCAFDVSEHCARKPSRRPFDAPRPAFAGIRPTQLGGVSEERHHDSNTPKHRGVGAMANWAGWREISAGGKAPQGLLPLGSAMTCTCSCEGSVTASTAIG
jgi:hypothetical protein